VRLETDDETDLADAVATVSREEKATDLSRLLSDGLLAHLLPPLESSKAHVDDLLKKQNHVLEVIEAENQRYQRTEAIQELSLKTAQIKVYHEKLLTIRKTMATLHDRSTRLKRRALKLQTEKQKEALAKATARDKEREREKKLVAKTDCASSPNST